MSKISVIIPAYNQDAYLGQAIESVLAQEFQEFEVIVVDDGSTDGTKEVAARYGDSRIRYIYQQNKGLSGARNRGIVSAVAPYLLFLDADDYLLPNALSLHCETVRDQPDMALSVGGWVLTDEKRNRISGDHFPPDSVDFVDLLKKNPFPVHSVLVARQWLDRAGLFDETLRACEDWDLWLRIARSGGQIVTHRQVICEYRTHPGQMTKQVQRMRTAMFAVLDKTFAVERIPEDLLNLKKKAYAAAYLKAAARAYHAMDLSDAKRDLQHAVELDPDLLDDGRGGALELLTSWAYAPSNTNPLAYLDRVFNNLPEDLAELRSRRRRDLGRMAMQLAFSAYQKGDLIQTRRFAWQAFCYQPTWVQNRGVLSIFLRSCLSLR
ncbi:MAG: glycosyltransferase [Caldilineaceae bacterium]|nr:glycosyltransferase [Caldilineaceae bacterium]